MVKHLIIIGCGGFAREVYWHAQDSLGYNIDWDLKGYLDGDIKLDADDYEKLELPVLGDIDSYDPEPDDVFICAITVPYARKRLVGKMMAKGAKFFTLVHRTAIVHGNVQLGKGVIVTPRVSIHDHAQVGDFTIINICTGVGHDACIGNYVDIMGGASITGHARIDDEAVIADGACIVPKAHVEQGAYVGTRSLVLKRVKAGTKVFGIPAMPI